LLAALSIYKAIDFYFYGAYKEAILLLSNFKYHHFSINGIAIDAGFSDRRNFYRVFKKATGLSPSEFVNHLGDAETTD